MVEGVFLQSGVTNSILNTMELLNLGSSSDHLQVLEALNLTYRNIDTNSFICMSGNRWFIVFDFHEKYTLHYKLLGLSPCLIYICHFQICILISFDFYKNAD